MPNSVCWHVFAKGLLIGFWCTILLLDLSKATLPFRTQNLLPFCVLSSFLLFMKNYIDMQMFFSQ